MDKDLKKIYLGGGIVFGTMLLLAALIFWVLIPLGEYLGKPAYLDVLVTPVEATVEIGGKEYRNAVYEMEPGTYTATVRLDGVEPEVVEFNLVQNETTGLYMNWTKSGGWQYYTVEELEHKNAIGEVTPLRLSICGAPAKRTNCDAVAVDYERNVECGGECLIISGRRAELTDEVLMAVRDKLAEKGYDLDDYKYVYIQNNEQ